MAVVQWAAESTIKMSIKRIERHTVQRQVTQSIIPNGKQNVKHGDVHCSHQRSSAACSLLISEVQYGDLHCSHQQSSAAVFTVDTRGPAWRCSLLTPGSSAAVFTVDTRDPARRCSLLTPEIQQGDVHVSFHTNTEYLVQHDWRGVHKALDTVDVHLNKSCPYHAHLS